MHEGFPYLVAEYAPNGSLRNRLERWSHRLLPLGEAITIIYQVGQALQYAHQQNIVHRDLKPENILFNAKGEVLLADFGLATILTTSSVKPSTITGTVAYMSPEQLQGSISKESDQYALGCIAYELFTERIPFNATDLTTLIVNHLTENPISPRQLNPGLPEHIEKAILKAMAKDRSMRHPDISAFLVALSKPSQGLSQEDRNARAQTILGITLLFPGDKEKIIAISEQATRLDPDFEFPYFTRGVALNDLGRYAEALEDFERSIKLDPHNAHSWFYKGDILQQFGRREEAQQAYNRAQALVGSNDDKELDHLFDFENNHDAVETMEQPFQFDSDAARVYYTKGLALERAQRYREALLAYERAIDLHPKYVAAWCSRGMVLLLLKCYKESVNAYFDDLPPNWWSSESVG